LHGNADYGDLCCYPLNFVRAKCTVAGEAGQIDIAWGAVEQSGKRARRIMDGMGVEPGGALNCSALARKPSQIDESAAADGALRRCISQYEAITRYSGNRAIEHELHAHLFARQGRTIAQQSEPRTDLSRRVMQSGKDPLRDRP